MINLKGEDSPEHVYEIPMKLRASGQLLPVDFLVKIQVTTNSIDITPKSADFGLIYENTSKKIEI